MWKKIDESSSPLCVTKVSKSVDMSRLFAESPAASTSLEYSKRRKNKKPTRRDTTKKEKTTDKADALVTVQASDETLKADEDLHSENSINYDQGREYTLINQSMEHWNEATVYHYFTRVQPLVIPTLIRVDEVIIRKRGGLKFRVIFENSRKEECPVIICGTLLYSHYSQEYLEAKALFKAHL